MARITYKSLFERYRDSTVILKATQYARWTLPQLMADAELLNGKNRISLERDYQSIGALLTNNLGAKLAGLLFPPNRPFFQVVPSNELKKHAESRGVKSSELQSGLARMETDSCERLFANGSFEQLTLGLKHLIATGNTLLFRDSETSKIITYGLQSYGVRRDGRGTVMDIILREYTDFEALPLDVQEQLRSRSRGRYKPENEGNNRVELYTRIKREMRPGGPVYVVSQEADDMAVGTAGEYPDYLCPWQPITWSLIIGEHYGRGLVEDYAGDFAKLSDLSQAATLYGIEVAKLVNLVAPGAGANIDELANAETGEYVQGNKDSVQSYSPGDKGTLQALREEVADVFARLARAFMYQGNTRDAERVTAFELRQQALEAENTLGGTYSSLSAAAQVPLAHILLTEVDPGSLEGLVSKTLRLTISAGLAALGRAANIQNLAAVTQEASAIVPALGQLDSRISKTKVMDLILAGHSIDTEAIFKDDEEIAEDRAIAAQEQQGQQQIAQATGLQEQANVLQGLQQ